MKRALIIAVLASAIFSACNYEVESLINTQGAVARIGFIPMVTTQTSTGSGSDFTDSDKTRATPTDIDVLRQDGFTVYAYSSDDTVDWTSSTATAALYPDWMFAQSVTWESSSYVWSYYPITYWPQSDLLSFFAFSPFSAAHTTPVPGQTGAPTLGYETPLMIENQVDLLAGTDLNRGGTAYTDINIQFRHTLSKIGFSARLDMSPPEGSTDTLRVHSLKVYFENDGNFRNKGTYSFVNNSWTIDETSAFGGGSVDLEWGDDKDFMTPITCIWAGDVVSLDEYKDDDDPTNEKLQGVKVPSPITVTSLNSGDDYLMLMPQQYEAESMFIEVKYSTSVDASVETTVLPIPQILKSAGGDIIPFEVGKQYTFLLTLSTIRDIVFGGVTVGDWNDNGYFYFDF
ncbi:MAG: fimbrillin family protein [Rikenellaceae bacterium]